MDKGRNEYLLIYTSCVVVVVSILVAIDFSPGWPAFILSILSFIGLNTLVLVWAEDKEPPKEWEGDPE